MTEREALGRIIDSVVRSKSVPISDKYIRVVQECDGNEAYDEAVREAFRIHHETGEAVQVAYPDGCVHSLIREDGCLFGNLAWFG